MEDENGLELSLGLGRGGSSAKSKGKSGCSSDSRTEEGDISNKLVDDFKSFIQASEPAKPQENFFNDLSKANADVDASFMGLWGSSSRPADVEEEKRSEVGNKRKLLHDEFSNQKKASHISITADEGSTAENEDVAESDVVDGSTSRFIGIGGPSDFRKRINGSSETDISHANLNYGVPRPTNIVNMPYSSSIGAPATSGHTIQGMGTLSSNPGTSPVMFGYSYIQLPTLDKDNSWGLDSHLQQGHPAFANRGPPNSDKQNDGPRITPAMQVISRTSSEPTLYGGRTLEGSSTQTEDDVKGTSTNIGSKDASGPSTTEGVTFDFSTIKPGIASDLKFGGCGSYPNLPWVSTTGTGPNGRTISGVTYKFSTNQIKIVCACHGSHMSPEEFVRHASEEIIDPVNGGGLAPLPNTNPAASAQS